MTDGYNYDLAVFMDNEWRNKKVLLRNRKRLTIRGVVALTLLSTGVGDGGRDIPCPGWGYPLPSPWAPEARG